jgi:predicted amidophosphoribosyltransferase
MKQALTKHPVANSLVPGLKSRLKGGLGLSARSKRLTRSIRPTLAVAIVDDVLTTGATVEALGKALRRAGCRRIEAWAVVRA